jgi:flagellar protein FliO/FliZ
VAIVQVADRALILGVTDQQVSLLGETELVAFDAHGHHHEHRDHLPLESAGPPDARPPAHHQGRLDGSLLSPRTWGSTLDFLRDRTTRR